ncbi:hypothetical protein FOCC_FOCC016054 [Frankliniella occidentalis]|nr:hypothetical protein FOCC_FOCC016054 [Frankliniella occidentalis]
MATHRRPFSPGLWETSSRAPDIFSDDYRLDRKAFPFPSKKPYMEYYEPLQRRQDTFRTWEFEHKEIRTLALKDIDERENGDVDSGHASEEETDDVMK